MVNREAARFSAVTIQFIIHPPYNVPAGLACCGKTWCNISITVDCMLAIEKIKLLTTISLKKLLHCRPPLSCINQWLGFHFKKIKYTLLEDGFTPLLVVA